MTCWPRGKGGLPIRSSAGLAPAGNRRARPHRTAGRAPPATPRTRARRPAAPRTAAPAALEGPGASCRPFCRPPSAPPQRKVPERVLLQVSSSGCPGGSAAEAGPHVLLRGVSVVPKAAVLYHNRKGKATTFLLSFFFFSDIWYYSFYMPFYILKL